ncbi:MAG: flagellar biosynthesis protein FliQ [Dehalococcoidia bacterium]|nr:MAG: flagellar biosynthesis protein FliQ [Dehalococcoidia bacterium]
MNDATVIGLGQGALMTALMVAAPILVVSLGVGVLVSVFQAMTQINEATLSFVPKLLGVFAVSALAGPWMIGTMVDYTTQLFVALPDLAR